MKSKEIIKKTKETKKNNKAKYWTILEIGDDVTIGCDRYQLVVDIKGEWTSYYNWNSLDHIIENLLYRKAILLMVQKEKKSIENVLKSFNESREWFATFLAPVLAPFSMPWGVIITQYKHFDGKKVSEKVGAKNLIKNK